MYEVRSTPYRCGLGTGRTGRTGRDGTHPAPWAYPLPRPPGHGSRAQWGILLAFSHTKYLLRTYEYFSPFSLFPPRAEQAPALPIPPLFSLQLVLVPCFPCTWSSAARRVCHGADHAWGFSHHALIRAALLGTEHNTVHASIRTRLGAGGVGLCMYTHTHY